MMSGNTLKLLWNRLRHNHLLLMALCCLVPLGLVAGWLYLFKNSGDSWIWLIFLLCLPLHVWMMKGHGHDDCDKNKNSDPAHKKAQQKKRIIVKGYTVK